MDLGGNLALRFEHCAPEIASAHAELDGDVALLVLAINEGVAWGQADLGDVTQRDRDNPVAVGIGSSNGDMTHGIQALPVFRRQAHDDGEVPVAAVFIEVAGRLTAELMSPGARP